ncbi:MAG TPA: DUF1543 domain-containing protein [Novosphingobium sp.]|nr:DUF1543 domain-containing protein [Novosphingobium sp.]
MKNLYMFFVGGTAPGANIEIHDVQFAVVEKPEEAFAGIANRWFADQELLHIDVIRRVNWVDGYDVTIGSGPSQGEARLFFVNMGGYFREESFERHAFEVIAAKSEVEAKAIAKSRFFNDHEIPHRDFLMDIDGFLALDKVGEEHIHLIANQYGAAELPSFQGYLKIGGNKFVYDETIDDLVHEDEARLRVEGIGNE